MIESNFENLIKAYRKIKMTSEEKREVFKQSMLVIEKIEAVSLIHGDAQDEVLLADAATLDALAINGSNQGNNYMRNGKKAILLNWISYVKKRQFIPALVAAFLLLFTGGASLLAEQALPGDSLYAFKVNVNESVRDLTAVSDEAKARLAVEMTERRLQEAAVLSAQGKLNEDNKKILQDQFVKRADQIKNRVASLVSSNDLNAAQEVTDDFVSALQTHELILESLSIATGETVAIATTTPPTDPLNPGNSGNTDPLFAIAMSATGSVPIDPTQTTAFTVSRVIPKPVVASLLVTVKSELDSASLSRTNIQERVFANLASASATGQATATSAYQLTSPQTIIESNIKELRFTISDIQEELKAYPYATGTVNLVNKRIEQASSTIEKVFGLVKSNQMIEASIASRAALQSLAEVEAFLKLEKGTRASVDGKIDIASIFGDHATTTPTTTPSATGTSPSPGQGF